MYDANALSSPTTKFVTVGEFPPDTFYVLNTSGVRTIVANPHEVHYKESMVPQTKFDILPYNFNKSPLVQLPGGGPSVGLAFVSGSSSS